MVQDKIDVLEIELESTRETRKMYNGEDIKELLKLYKEENDILKRQIDLYKDMIKEKIEYLKEVNSKRV